MKRFLVIMMLGLLCLALVGGCGKKQEEAPAVEQTAPATDTAAAMPDTSMHDTSGATK